MGEARMSRSVSIILCLAFLAIVVAGTVAILLVVAQNYDNDDDDTSHTRPRSTVPPRTETSPSGEYRFAAVSSDGQPCSTIGTKILAEKGGSAVDAAIATMLCIGVVNCHSSGIGGGHFMNIYDRAHNGTEKEFLTILARERAPAAATQDMFVADPGKSTVGGLAVGIPGEVKGFHEAWKRFGRAEWADLFKDSIKLCRDGYVMSKALAAALTSSLPVIENDASWQELFRKPDGSWAMEGDIVINAKLADTLQAIADDPEAFYNPDSQLAKDIVADIQDANGIITLQDLQGYVPYFKQPIHVKIANGNLDVYSPRPPSSGVVLEYMLKILDGYNFGPDSIATMDEKILTYHRIAEAFKFAYAKRSALGDEEFEDVEELLNNMTSDSFTDDVRQRVNDSYTYDLEYYEPEFELVIDGGTAHANILAPDGGAVAITCTVNLYFGSKVRGTRTGIVFNNEMDDFSTPNTINAFGVPASPSNYIVPGKMPMSSMSPTIFLDQNGRVKYLGGAEGGTTITTTTALIAMRTLWFGQAAVEAIDEPRMHHQLAPHHIAIEDDFNQELADGLRAKGHVLVSRPSIATSQNIHNTCPAEADEPIELTRCIRAVSDRRKAGKPDGF